MAFKTKKALQKKLNDYALAEKKIKMNQPGCREDFLSKKTELDDIYNKMSKFLGDSNRDQNPTFIELREKIPVLFRAFRKRWGVAYEHLKIVNEELMVDERWNTLCGIAIRIDICSPEAIDRFNKGETFFRGEIDFAQEKELIHAEIDRVWNHLHLLGIKKKRKGYQLNKISSFLEADSIKKEFQKKFKKENVTSTLVAQGMEAKGLYEASPTGESTRQASRVRKQLQKLYQLIGIKTKSPKKLIKPIINKDIFGAKGKDMPCPEKWDETERILLDAGLGTEEYTKKGRYDVHKSKGIKDTPKDHIVYLQKDGATKIKLQNEPLLNESQETNDSENLFNDIKYSKEKPEILAPAILKEHGQKETPEKIKEMIKLIEDIRR